MEIPSNSTARVVCPPTPGAIVLLFFHTAGNNFVQPLVLSVSESFTDHFSEGGRVFTHVCSCICVDDDFCKPFKTINLTLLDYDLDQRSSIIL